jgi:hypothetical protein
MSHQLVNQLVIMVSPDNPPFSSYSPTGGISGFDVELISAVCQETELECPVVLAPLSAAWPASPKGYMGSGLMQKQFDCAASFGVTTARNSTSLLFSMPYTKQEVGILLERKAGGGSCQCASGSCCSSKRLGVVTSSSCGADLARDRMPLVQLIVEFEDGRALFAALEAGTVDGILICGMAQAMELINNATQQVAPLSLQAVSDGLAFMCHPSKAYQVRLLDLALNILRTKDSGLYLQNLCSRYPNIQCEYQVQASAGAVSSAALQPHGHIATVLALLVLLRISRLQV